MKELEGSRMAMPPALLNRLSKYDLVSIINKCSELNIGIKVEDIEEREGLAVHKPSSPSKKFQPIIDFIDDINDRYEEV